MASEEGWDGIASVVTHLRVVPTEAKNNGV